MTKQYHKKITRLEKTSSYHNTFSEIECLSLLHNWRWLTMRASAPLCARRRHHSRLSADVALPSAGPSRHTLRAGTHISLGHSILSPRLRVLNKKDMLSHLT